MWIVCSWITLKEAVSAPSSVGKCLYQLCGCDHISNVLRCIAPYFMISFFEYRPQNLVLGRIFDGHLYDAIELGVDQFKSLKSFSNAATGAQLGSKVRGLNSLVCFNFLFLHFASEHSLMTPWLKHSPSFICSLVSFLLARNLRVSLSSNSSNRSSSIISEASSFRPSTWQASIASLWRQQWTRPRYS